MRAQKGQIADILKYFPNANTIDIIVEAGNDKGGYFNGEFMAEFKIGRRKIIARFDEGKLIKTAK